MRGSGSDRLSHGMCSRRQTQHMPRLRLAPFRAPARSRLAVAELGVVRRRYLKNMKRIVLFLYFCLCILCSHVCAEPKNRGSSNKSTGSLEFVIVDRNPQTFRITNNTNRAVTLDSLFGQPSEYDFAPNHATYEHLSGKRWIPIEWVGDTVA